MWSRHPAEIALTAAWSGQNYSRDLEQRSYSWAGDVVSCLNFLSIIVWTVSYSSVAPKAARGAVSNSSARAGVASVPGSPTSSRLSSPAETERVCTAACPCSGPAVSGDALIAHQDMCLRQSIALTRLWAPAPEMACAQPACRTCREASCTILSNSILKAYNQTLNPGPPFSFSSLIFPSISNDNILLCQNYRGRIQKILSLLKSQT